MVVRWVLNDPVASTTYTFTANPSEGGQAPYRKRINYEFTTDPDGGLTFYEGRDEPRVATISGTVLTQQVYDDLAIWFQKRHAVQLTDDLGRSYSVYFTSFEMTRTWARDYPWRHNYTVEYLVLAEL